MSQVAHIWEGTLPRRYEVAEQPSPTTKAARGARIGVLPSALFAVAFLLPLAVLPGLEQPFSSPKLVLFAAVVLCGILICARRVQAACGRLPFSLRIALEVWLVALSASALGGQFASLQSLVLPLCGAGWFMLLLAARPRADLLVWVLVLSGSTVAVIAVAQFLHADPFSALGWIPASGGNARMRVFSTLGNPNFVAAFLSGLLPLTFSLASESRKQRWLLTGLSALQAAEISATGSRAPILALAAGLLWMTGLRGAA
jgi:hypothetical protein